MPTLKNLEKHLEEGDALLIVPPFSSLDKPSLGVHTLQACARKAGFNIKVLYANFAFARIIGERLYQLIAYNTNPTFAGEKIFYDAAFGDEKSEFKENSEVVLLNNDSRKTLGDLKIPELSSLQKSAVLWADEICRVLAKKNYKVIGCTSTFEQTSASLSLLKRIKRARPDITTILGGANCQEVMAKGILSLSDAVDYIFSGESESAFPAFLRDILDGLRPQHPVITCEACDNLDAIPLLRFTDFYRQFSDFLPDGESEMKNIWMPYETSRGCWYGQKRQCRFCGINGQTIRFRMKSEEHVLWELKELLSEHPNRNVSMSDCNMPHSYFKTLLPRLAGEFPNLQVFYELKANMSLADMEILKRAGIVAIQPGIESLSTPCLELMNKGVTSQQNLALLRYARILDFSISWNILYGVPNDAVEDYQRMYEILPLLSHLQPPLGVTSICIERFSPYFTDPDKFGLSNIRPIEQYSQIFPKTCDIETIAYHFRADYKSESLENNDLMNDFSERITKWKRSWSNGEIPPSLAVTALNQDEYLLVDTRGLAETQEFNIISESKASLVLAGARAHAAEEIEWALQRKLMIEHDSKLIPLCTAQPELMRQFAVN